MDIMGEKKLAKADLELIAEVTGCVPRYVRMVLSRRRPARSPKAQRIVAAYKELDATRQEIREKYSRQTA